MSDLMYKCLDIYEEGGQYAVLDYVRKNRPNVPWKFCVPCDCMQPFDHAKMNIHKIP